MTVGIPQQDLNLAVVEIENEVKGKLGNTPFPFPFLIKVIWDDLKLEGITREQPMRDFTATNKPLSEVLTVHAACDAAAEPVRESTSSHDF